MNYNLSIQSLHLQLTGEEPLVPPLQQRKQLSLLVLLVKIGRREKCASAATTRSEEAIRFEGDVSNGHSMQGGIG